MGNAWGAPTLGRPLLGRAAETAQVTGLLASARVVSLVGPGGIGKTRLAEHVSAVVAERFDGGVHAVALAELSEPELLVATVGAAVDGSRRGPQDLDQLSQALAGRTALLVLDNCEHLAGAVAELCLHLLAQCPELRVLVTSREPLRIEDEALVRVPPLALPGPDDLVEQSSEQLSTGFAGVALFVERAQLHNPEFRLDAGNTEAVVQVCRNLDGLPLAIELAAASTRNLPLEVLAAESGAELPAAWTNDRSAPPRQRSLGATLEHSHRLCSTSAQQLWARLSVFRGGADFASVSAVCTAAGGRPDELWPALAELVDKSVVGFDGTRYRMLETIRRYGAERLAASDEAQVVARAHRDHFASLADAVQDTWSGPRQQAVLRNGLDEHANLRAALEHCLGKPEEAGTGLLMATSLWGLWTGCGLMLEGRLWLERFADAQPAATPGVSTALWMAGALAASSGDQAAGLALLARAAELAAADGDVVALARTQQFRGNALLFGDDLEAAVAELRSSVAAERSFDWPNPFLVRGLVALGTALTLAGELDEAQATIGEVQRICADLGDEHHLAWGHVVLGLVALRRGQAAQSRDQLQAALTRKRTVPDALGATFAVELLGWCAVDLESAANGLVLMGGAASTSAPLGTHLAGSKPVLRWRQDYLAAATRSVGVEQAAVLLDRGRSMGLDSLVATALDLGSTAHDGADDPLGALTRREREVAALVAAGMTNKQIAAHLVIAPRTVDTHVEHILSKLGVSSRTMVARLHA